MMRSFVYWSLTVLFSICATGIAHAGMAHLGPRPFYLVDSMDEGPLKERLLSCKGLQFESSDFSIAHRGAPLQFPEHTMESYLAAATMGAGIVECDVTFTKDRELVCRHSQCDLHTSTNILAIPELAAKCKQGFTPALLNTETGKVVRPATAKCCTSDITLDEFLSLKGKMDAASRSALSVKEYMAGTAPYRTDLYAESGTVMSHAQSISLFKQLGVKMMPELKSADVPMPFEGEFSQQAYAEKLVDEYRQAGVHASDVWLQSFNLDDVSYWIENTEEYGQQAVYLDGRYADGSFNPADEATWKPSMVELVNSGVRIIAPPLWMLLQSSSNNIAPSLYAQRASDAGLDIVTWTLERSGFLSSGGGWYYQSVKELINNDADIYTVLDVLAQDVGVSGVLSDWPATVTYYANCLDL